MPAESQAAVADPVEQEAAQPETTPDSQTDSKSKTKKQPPYAVILHNDDLNGMDYVVGVLRKVFHYGRLKSIGLMLKAHVTGRCIVWTGSLEVAELKADQLKSCGPDPVMKSRGAGSLSVTVEPLPG